MEIKEKMKRRKMRLLLEEDVDEVAVLEEEAKNCEED